MELNEVSDQIVLRIFVVRFWGAFEPVPASEKAIARTDVSVIAFWEDFRRFLDKMTQNL